MTLPELLAEHAALLHSMQSGVKYTIEYGLDDAHSPKHLRTGVNNALVSNGALVDILIQKGIFTEEEFMTAYNNVLRKEVASYEDALSKHLKTKITLL